MAGSSTGNGKILPQVSRSGSSPCDIQWLLLFCLISQICRNLFFFSNVWIDFMFLVCCIQNLPKSDSLKRIKWIRERDLGDQLAPSGHQKMVAVSMKELQPCHFRTCRKSSSLGSHSSREVAVTGVSPKCRWVRGILQQELFCANLGRIDLSDSYVAML